MILNSSYKLALCAPSAYLIVQPSSSMHFHRCSSGFNEASSIIQCSHLFKLLTSGIEKKFGNWFCYALPSLSFKKWIVNYIFLNFFLLPLVLLLADLIWSDDHIRSGLVSSCLVSCRMIIRWRWDDDEMMMRWWWDDDELMMRWWWDDDEMMMSWWWDDD